MKKLTALGLLLASIPLHASTVAVVDSGVDVLHRALVDNIWINPIEIPNNGRDEDGNGYQDDIYGWNSAEDNNQVIDRRYLGTFSRDPYRFFEIQKKMMLGVATTEDIEWLKSKREDEKFTREMGIFGNFIHGTHVAGIVAHENAGAKIISLKIMPTEVKLPSLASMYGQRTNLKAAGTYLDENVDELIELPEGKSIEVTAQEYMARISQGLPVAPAQTTEDRSIRLKSLKFLLKKQGELIGNSLNQHLTYLRGKQIDVLNGSYGVPYPNTAAAAKQMYQFIMLKEASEEMVVTLARIVYGQALHIHSALLAKNPRTLYVFAAGNERLDNDLYPSAPTNVMLPHVISVAATYRDRMLAPFSNYGARMVDIAAPGMIINSSIPGDEFMEISGTSQAAPYVAKVASIVKDTNPRLTAAQIKRILMQTVDKKDFLRGKVASAGIVNLARAVKAAEFSRNANLTTSIAQAHSSVRMLKNLTIDDEMPNLEAVTPIKMPSSITFRFQ